MAALLRFGPVVLLTALAALPLAFSEPALLRLLIQGCIWVMVAVSWDLVSGYTGQISCGHAGFFAVGAYAAALFAGAGGNPWLGLAAAAAAAGLAGLLVGALALQVRGPYVALVTLGFAEAVRLGARNWQVVTGGYRGLKGVPGLPGLPVDPVGVLQGMSLVALALAAATALALWWLAERSTAGRAFKAIREDEALAAAFGIDTAFHKLLAFAVSAVGTGLAGGLFAYYFGWVSPWTAGTYITTLAAAMTVFGGMGTIFGPVFGAAALAGVGAHLGPDGPVWQQPAAGLLLVVCVAFCPGGVVGWWRRWGGSSR